MLESMLAGRREGLDFEIMHSSLLCTPLSTCEPSLYLREQVIKK